MKFLNYAAGLALAALSVYIMALGKNILIPLVIALILSYIIITLSLKYQRFLDCRLTCHIPHILTIIGAIATCIFAIYIFFSIVNANVNNVLREAPNYQNRLSGLVEKIQREYPSASNIDLKQVLSRISIPAIISELANTATSIAGNASIIMIYVLFILLETRRLDRKILALFPQVKKRKQFLELFAKINRDIKIYISIKFFMSLITGLLSFVVLHLVGVDFASFWALIIFTLNFIPTIGSIIATIFPILLTIIQFDSLVPFAIVSIALISIQMLIGNIIEPRYMGRSLNLSPLVIIFSLMIMGSIWGIIGMLISVPILGIINIILAKFPQTRPIAVILSSDGNIK